MCPRTVLMVIQVLEPVDYPNRPELLSYCIVVLWNLRICVYKLHVIYVYICILYAHQQLLEIYIYMIWAKHGKTTKTYAAHHQVPHKVRNILLFITFYVG